MNCLVSLYFADDGYIPEKCNVHLLWAHTDGWGWNKGPGKLWPEANEWYKDMKKQTGVDILLATRAIKINQVSIF